ncbi:MAG: hypothetical protein FWF25_01275 [Propionibacteriaceae bacterium]|nr:hypothetical protein [Propionibacteriaceae bacterium]
MMSEELEVKLQEVLAARSVPGQVTDLDAGTLSDQDREAQLRAHLVFAADLADAENRLKITDKGLLMEIAAGF